MQSFGTETKVALRHSARTLNLTEAKSRCIDFSPNLPRGVTLPFFLRAFLTFSSHVCVASDSVH